MKKKDTKIDIDSFRKQIPIDAIGDDFIMMDDISEVPFFEYPTKIDFAVLSICLKGRIEGSIDLKPYSFLENDLFIVSPENIVQYSYKSDDYSGMYIAMSKRFTDYLELNVKDSVSNMLYLREKPIMHLSPDEVASFLEYYSLIRQTVRKEHHPSRIEMTRLLILALFYNFRPIQGGNIALKSKREGLFDKFYHLLLKHYKESREVGFYAEKLCLTPKYLSAAIKELTGKSAFDWINDYVILEAKSLLKSSNMTVLQISDELNFISQTFFGKYFKRLTGMSPKEYRRS
jgi:AraC-like DNA-binding protein